MAKNRVVIRPNPTTLNTIRYVVSSWNSKIFQDLGIEASPYEIEAAKRETLKAIKEWTFLNPRSTYSHKSNLRWKPYIKEDYGGLTHYIKILSNLEYDLASEIINSVAERMWGLPNFKDEKNLGLSYRRMKAELGISIKFNIKLKDGSFITKEILETLFKKFSEWHLEDLGDRVELMQFDRTDPSKSYRYHNYNKVLDQISNYAKVRGFNLFDGSGSFIINGRRYDYQNRLTNDYDQYFNDQAYKNFAVLYHLTKYLGFDPYSFTPQSDADIANGKFRLHHYLANVFRKMSSHLEDVTLVMDTLHYPLGIYETLKETEIGEAEIRGLLQSITDLIYYKDSLGNPKASVGRTEIREVLIKNLGAEKGQEAFLRWTSRSKFTVDLIKFNDYRSYAISGKFLELLLERFPKNYRIRYADAQNFVKSGAFQLKLRSFISTEASLDFLNYLYKLSVKMPTSTQTSLQGTFI